MRGPEEISDEVDIGFEATTEKVHLQNASFYEKSLSRKLSRRFNRKIREAEETPNTLIIVTAPENE